MVKTKGYRHGDLLLVYEIDGKKVELPQGLKLSKEKDLMIGSGGNAHSYDKGEFYPKQDGNFIIGYFVAKDTILSHPDHGKKVEGKMREVKLENKIYQLRRQNEETHGAFKKVID